MPSYRTPILTVDAIIVDKGKVVLIQRKKTPFKGMWALPGGFVEYGERVEDAVVREALEETGLKVKIKALVGVYSNPNRDPRKHTVSVSYLCRRVGGRLVGGDDAAEACEFEFKSNALPKMAFDHSRILRDAYKIFYSKRGVSGYGLLRR